MQIVVSEIRITTQNTAKIVYTTRNESQIATAKDYTRFIIFAGPIINDRVQSAKAADNVCSRLQLTTQCQYRPVCYMRYI